MDTTCLSLLNELLDRVRAMDKTDGQSSVYDKIGLKPDDREIYVPPNAHLVATIKALAEDAPL